MRLDDPLRQFVITYKHDLDAKNMTDDVVCAFRQALWDFYKQQRRSFEWREIITPYSVVVSEIMLQQTQTSRVKEKFSSFTAAFPDFSTLASASSAAVISEWVGLGYNRRALALHDLAKKVVIEWNNILPQDPKLLQTCKGIGPATAASIITFAFNKPTVFIETNVRAVFLHLFFQDQKEPVSDIFLLPLIEQTVDREAPRDWYYALMDYGVLIKKLYKNPSRKSKYHTKQSRFEGSDRQLRGAVLRLLSHKKKATQEELLALDGDLERMQKIVEVLVKERFIERFEKLYFLKM